MPRFENIGSALRYLRLHAGPEPRKQLEIAERAQVTRGMLSAYERGHQEPTLRTLERVLEALGVDLVELQWALRVIEARPGEGPPPPPARHPPDEVAEPAAVYRTVRVPEPLSAGEEHALGQMIAGFLAYLRYSRDAANE
jgi:transcriptional regulator with XRE-family HTH domain